MHSGEKGIGSFCISSGDSAPSFDVQEGIFHQMPQLVEVFVIVARLFAVATWRNLDLHTLCGGPLQDGIAVISFVGDQMLSHQSFGQRSSARTIRHGTRCNKDSERHTMRIHGQMQLGVEPPFVRPIS